MASLDDVLAALFASLVPIGSLVALLLIFAIDAALFPALPEAWILITYTFRPETMDAVGWAAILLVVAVAARSDKGMTAWRRHLNFSNTPGNPRYKRNRRPTILSQAVKHSTLASIL